MSQKYYAFDFFNHLKVKTFIVYRPIKYWQWAKLELQALLCQSVHSLVSYACLS
jgi:hypothetical protein